MSKSMTACERWIASIWATLTAADTLRAAFFFGAGFLIVAIGNTSVFVFQAMKDEVGRRLVTRHPGRTGRAE